MGAFDEALVALGEVDHPILRYHLAEHRTWALAMLGREQHARQWLMKAEKARRDLLAPEAIDEADLGGRASSGPGVVRPAPGGN